MRGRARTQQFREGFSRAVTFFLLAFLVHLVLLVPLLGLVAFGIVLLLVHVNRWRLAFLSRTFLATLLLLGLHPVLGRG